MEKKMYETPEMEEVKLNMEMATLTEEDTSTKPSGCPSDHGCGDSCSDADY